MGHLLGAFFGAASLALPGLSSATGAETLGTHDATVSSIYSLSCSQATQNHCLALAAMSGSQQSATLSTIDGQNWTATPTSPQVSSFGAYGCDPSGALCVASGTLLLGNGTPTLLYFHGGTNWIQATTIPGVLTQWGVHPKYGAVSCASTTACDALAIEETPAQSDMGLILGTTDGGVTWSVETVTVMSSGGASSNCLTDAGPAGIGITGSYCEFNSISCPTVSVCYASILSGTPTVIVGTANGGSTWSPLYNNNPNNQSITVSSISCASALVCRAATGYWAQGNGNMGVIGTCDGGVTWSSLGCSQGSSARPGRVASRDLSGLSVEQVSCATTSVCEAIGFSGPGIGGTPVIVGTGDAGSTWTQQSVPSGVTHLSAISCGSATSCVVAGTSTSGGSSQGVLFGTSNDGSTWQMGTISSSGGGGGGGSSGPTITGVSPSAGSTSGGTSVTITGSGFTGATAVHFGSAAASIFSVVSDMSITANSPPGSAGQVDISVTTPGGTSTPSLCSDGFDYGGAAPSASAGSYTAVAPARIADTRSGATDPATYAGKTLQACSTIDIAVTGAGGVPAGASAAVVNVTAVSSLIGGFLTVYPQGSQRPLTSNLNFGTVQAVPNLVEVPLSSSGGIEVYNGAAAPTDVIVDVEGYIAPGSSGGLFVPLSPARLCDTRAGTSTPCTGMAPGPQVSVFVPVAGTGGVPSSGAAAVVLNVTAINPSATGFLTVYPDGSNTPTTSNVNYGPGQTVPNRVIVPIGSSGKVDIFSSAGTPDIAVDVNGYFTTSGGTGAQFHPLSPTRITDTRTGSGLPNAGSTLSPKGTLAVSVGGTGGIPTSGAKAVALNVTVTNTTAGGFMTAYPTDPTPPNASDLNWSAGETVPNFVIVQLGSTGGIDLFNSAGSTDVIVDVVGWFG